MFNKTKNLAREAIKISEIQKALDNRMSGTIKLKDGRTATIIVVGRYK